MHLQIISVVTLQTKHDDMANEIEKQKEAFLIYQDENGLSQVNVRFEGEDVWLTQSQMAELFQADRTSVVRHITIKELIQKENNLSNK